MPMTASQSQTAQRNAPLEIRSGVARFDNGAELAMRSIELRPGTAIETTADDGSVTRTVEVVWTSGAEVTRWSWRDGEYYVESLEVSDSAIDLSRMRNGASVLNSHWSYDLADVLGVVEEVRIEDGLGIARVRISARASLDELWGDIKAGIIRHISVGYTVQEWSTRKVEGERTRKTAVRWQPHEISFVAVPADQACTVRSQPDTTNASTRASETNMPIPANPNDAGANTERTATQTAPANDNNIVAAERARIADITRYADRFGVDAAARNAAIDGGTAFADFVRAQIDAQADASRDTAVTNVRVGRTLSPSPEDEAQLRAAAFTHRAMSDIGMRDAAPALTDQARQYVGDGMRGLAIMCLRNAGQRVNDNADDRTIVSAAVAIRSHGDIASTDLGHILAQPVRAVLETRYEDALADTNYQSWTGSTTTRNFNPSKAIHAGMLTGIRDVSEGGQLPLGRLGAGARYFKLGTRGLKVSFTRESIINDEFGVLLQAVGKLGIVYRHDEQAIAVRALLRGKMTTDAGEQDIFNEVYGNTVTVDALDVDGYAKAAMALRSQKPGEEYGDIRISVRPRKLLVSPDLEMAALKLVAPVMAGRVNEVNPVANLNLTVEVIDELPEKTAFLTGSGSLADVIQVARLAGEPGPQIMRLPQTTIQAIEWESINDFTAFGAGRFGIVKINVR